ncbi:MAG: sel1 repeat family protein, partial [Alphaproteobacteria bacterium]|nr:sel1 repeat family protein [Alphaproteobacteria bacterium]
MTQTETQLSRLDSIENQLQDVITQFSQGGGVGFATGDGMPAAGIDADALADTAAARIVDHLSATGQGTGSEAGIEDVRNLIEGFLNEHREGNEQTALMLDTIQQAMIRILDRLDVLEAGGVPAAEPHYEVDAAAEPVPHSQDEMEMASQGWVEPEGSLPASDDDVVLTEEHAGYAQPAEEEAVVEIHGRDEAAAVGDHAGVETAPMQSGDESAVNLPQAEDLAGSQVPQADPQVQQPQPEASSGYASPDLLSDRSAAADVPAEPQAASRETIDKIRHNFIADAQQAKAKAAHAAAAAAATGEQPKKGSARRSVLAGMKSPSTDVESTGGMFGSKTRRLLVGALLAVIVINGALFLLPRDEAPAAIEAPAATSEPVDKQTQKTKTPSLDQSNLMTTDDGFAPPVKTNVVMDDLRQAVLDAEHRAAGSADLPFGLVLQQTTAGAWTKAGRDLAQVMPASLKPADAVALPGSRTYAAPSTKETASRSKLPPLTVGPSSLRMAAANGDASAQFEVGTRLSEGKGTKQDFKQAATWFKRSAGQGFAQAQYRLGTLYERGLGLTRDVNRAQAWYLRAAEQGNIRAMHNLAVLSAGQSSGKPDYARAAQWFIKAAESGLADSQFNAGVLFENGLGVSQDLIQAYKWYTLAARTGDKESLKRSQKIRSKLAIDVLGEAETAVRSFAPAKVDPLVNNARLAGQDWKSRHNG